MNTLNRTITDIRTHSNLHTWTDKHTQETHTQAHTSTHTRTHKYTLINTTHTRIYWYTWTHRNTNIHRNILKFTNKQKQTYVTTHKYEHQTHRHTNTHEVIHEHTNTWRHIYEYTQTHANTRTQWYAGTDKHDLPSKILVLCLVNLYSVRKQRSRPFNEFFCNVLGSSDRLGTPDNLGTKHKIVPKPK